MSRMSALIRAFRAGLEVTVLPRGNSKEISALV